MEDSLALGLACLVADEAGVAQVEVQRRVGDRALTAGGLKAARFAAYA